MGLSFTDVIIMASVILCVVVVLVILYSIAVIIAGAMPLLVAL